jgi:hypothetical protein
VKILLDEARIDRIVAGRRASLLAGACLMSVPFLLPRGWGVGFLTGFAMFSLGIYASALDQWRKEPGLWMLALFLAFVFGGSWGYFEFLGLQSLLAARGANLAPRPMAWNDVKFTIDSGIALTLFGKIARFAASVTIANWARTRTKTARRGSFGPTRRGVPA